MKYDLNDVRKHAKLERMNNFATVFVFFTVLINIFITALGFEGHALRWDTSETNSHTVPIYIGLLLTLDFVFVSILRSAAPDVLTIPEAQLSPLPIDMNMTGLM